MQDPRYILLFDGVCHFCNGTVNFITDRDPKEKFVFAPLQSELAQQLLKEHQLPVDKMDTLVLIKGEKHWLRSSAALEITKNLKGLWPLLYFFVIIPPFLRNPVYNLVARNRYKWFGKLDACRLPTAAERKRFL